MTCPVHPFILFTDFEIITFWRKKLNANNFLFTLGNALSQKKHPYLLYQLNLILIFCWIDTKAQDDTSSNSYTELFDANNPFEINLILDVKSFIKNKDVDEYVDAKISYYVKDCTLVEKKVKIKPRGNRRKSVCYLPPIRIDFMDDDYQQELFDSWGKMKLVSSCKAATNFEQYVLKEYLAYKAYETLTEISFKTYFMKVNFIDSEGKKKPFSSYSFMLEDIDDLADRNDAVEVEINGLLPVHLYRPVMNLVGMYQFMISNEDWHMPNLHNMKLIKSTDHKKPQPIPVPYDLDYSGLVNANYAVQHERIPVESVTDRYYMGTCLTDEEYQIVIKNFLDHKEDILNLFKESNYLQKGSKNYSINYLNVFFDIIENQKNGKRMIMKDCD